MDVNSKIKIAISKSDLDEVKKIVDELDPNELRKQYVDITLHAFHFSNETMLSYLINIMIDDECFDEYANHILHAMLVEPDLNKIHTECVSLILNNVQNLNLSLHGENTLLHNLIYVYVDENMTPELYDIYDKIIINLLIRGANTSIQNNNGFTAFGLAVDYNNFRLLKLLVDHSLYPVGIEEVIYAMYENNYDFVEYLLLHVEDINKKTCEYNDKDDYDEHTMLWYAKRFKKCNNDIIKLLKMSGARE